MKRSKTYDGGISKRFKGNGNLEELWGEDLDVNDIDDCFKLITENLAEASFTCTQKNNVSILPSYNIFKKDKLSETSTSTQIGQAGCSKNVVGGSESTFKRHHSYDDSMSKHSLETKVKQLEESCLAKEGEVNILRSQIREMKKSSERDYVKKQTEWDDRLKKVNKKLNEATSELEFKSLEIVNLKQKFGMLKLNGLNQPSTSSQSQINVLQAMESKTPEVDESENWDDPNEDTNLLVLEEEEYPLEDVFPSSTFEFSHRETFMIEFEQDSEEYKRKHKTRGHLVPYINLDLQRYHSKIEEFKPKVTSLKAGRLLNFGYVHPDLFLMMKFSSKGFESEENYWYFNKLVCTSEQLMDNFYQYLLTIQRGLLKYKEIKDDDDKEDPEVLDFNLSPLTSYHWYYNELGISARQGIACLSKILPHCSYLRAYMLLNAKLKFSEKDDHLNYLSVTRKQKELNYKNTYNFLQLMLLAVKIIKRLELECFSSGFLCSVIDLINNSVLTVEIDEPAETYLFDLSFTMFSGKSTPNTCAYSLKYARLASKKALFVNKLCRFPENRGTCVLHLFFEQLETYLFKLDDLDLSIPSANLISFSLNIFFHNPIWINNNGYRRCKCLKQFIITTINVIYQTIKKYKYNLDEYGLHADKFYDINLLSRCVSLLHLLTHKCHDRLVKCVDAYSLYTDAIQITLDLKDFFTGEQQEQITALNDLLDNEELPKVDLEKLNSIEAWKRSSSTLQNTQDGHVSTNITEPVFPNLLPSTYDPKDPEFRVPYPRL